MCKKLQLTAVVLPDPTPYKLQPQPKPTLYHPVPSGTLRRAQNL